MTNISFIGNDYSEIRSTVHFEWHDWKLYKMVENCIVATDACQKGFAICWQEWETATMIIQNDSNDLKVEIRVLILIKDMHQRDWGKLFYYNQ